MDYTIIIKEIRNILFLTQTELAEKLGVSLNWLYKENFFDRGYNIYENK